MSNYFPKHTTHWHFEEPTVLRRFTFSLWEMAILTGIVLHLYRALITPRASSSLLVLGGSLAFGVLLLCAMTTVHLANFPLQRWVWRAPLFALIVVAAEAVTSLFLIWFGREPNGTARAEWSDWLPLMLTTLVTRMIEVVGWALILAGVVFVVRRTILREPVEEDPPEGEEEAARA